MIYDRPLTPEERSRSQRYYNLFCQVNGGSYMCLGETVIVLLAVRIQTPNVLLAVLSAVPYLGYLLLPLGIVHTGRVGAARSQADFWVLRNLAALMVATSSVLFLCSPPLAWTVMLFGSFLFYSFRAAGVVTAQPLIGDITTENDRGRLLGVSNMYYFMFGLVSLIVISALLHYCDSIWMLVGIIVFGAFMGIVASTFTRKIDETEEIRRMAHRPLLQQFKQTLGDLTLRRQIYAGFACNAAYIMLASISMATLKRGYGFSDTSAVLYSLVQMASSSLASKMTAKVSDRIGPRAITIGAYLVVFPICLSWVLMPRELGGAWWMIALCALPFVLIGAYTVTYNNAIVHYFLNSVPKERQVASCMFINLVTGVFASLFGMIASGFVLRWAERSYGSGLDMFKAYFACIGVLLLGGIPILLRLNVLNKATGKH